MKIRRLIGSIVAIVLGFYFGMTIYGLAWGFTFDPMIDYNPDSLKFHSQAMVLCGVSISAVCGGAMWEEIQKWGGLEIRTRVKEER